MNNATMTATIMIVEDEAAVRELLVLSLEAQEFETVAAANLTDALARLESTEVDLLLLDLRLGAESGIDLLKAVRRFPKYEKLPVILLTGCADRNVVLQVAQLGVQGYLLKHQFSRKELTARIHQLLKARQSPEPASDVGTSAVGEFETGALSLTLLRVIKPALTQAQTIEQVERGSESNELSAAVAKLLKMLVDPEHAREEIAEVIGNFRKIEPGKNFSYELFWEHSIATGLIAAEITRLRNNEPQAINFAFAMGLLHDVAQLILLEKLDDIYKRVLDTAARLQLPLEQVESCMLLSNHADLANQVLNPARFPKRLTDAIAAHHLPAESILRLSPQKKADVATLVLADRLAHALLLGFAGNNCHYPTETLAKALEMTGDAIQVIEKQIPEQTASLMGQLFPEDQNAAGSDFRNRSLQKFRRPLRPLYINAQPDCDGNRILLQHLADPDDNHPANIAIIYLANLEDADYLFKALREQEKAANIKPLPLIVVSPLPNLVLDPKVLAGREHRKMPSPFTLLRLADMVGALLATSEE
jgi:DNA-binding response OmpR family regulator